LKLFGERIMSRDPDRQTAEIQIRIAIMNRFSALGRAEIEAIARKVTGKGIVRPINDLRNNAQPRPRFDRRAGRASQLLSLVRDKRSQALGIRRTLWHDPAVLGEVSAERVDGLAALLDEQLPDPEDAGSLRFLADHLGASGIILLPPDEGLQIGGLDEPDVMAQPGQFPPPPAPPEMRAPAGLHRHQTVRQLAEELRPSELLAQNHAASGVSTVDLEHILREIQTPIHTRRTPQRRGARLLPARRKPELGRRAGPMPTGSGGENPGSALRRSA
ncbi:hypothetical protein BV392_20195, partial [Rhodovulum sulfidophilum]